MNIESILVKIPKKDSITVDYIETELSSRKLTPLRWAIVDIDETAYTISVANIKIY